MDETSASVWQSHRRGTVFVDKKRRRGERVVQRVPRGKRRCCLTHVALICDRSDLQPLMPQVVIGNEKTFKAGDIAASQAACPSNVLLVRQRSAWNNEMLCARVIRLLAAALLPHRHELQPVLLLNAVRLHTARLVVSACVAAGIWPVLVPARATWLLQPLGTHAFQKYKAMLQEKYQAMRLQVRRADLTAAQLLQCLCATIRASLQAHMWGSAFSGNGYGEHQEELSAIVKRHLGLEEFSGVSAERPSLEQLRHCFPRGFTIPAAALWRPFDGLAVRSSASLQHRACRPALVPGVAHGLARLGRTRPQHRVAQVALAKAAAGEASVSAVPAVPRAVRLPSANCSRR